MTHFRLRTIAAAVATYLAVLPAVGGRAGTIWDEYTDGDLSGGFNSPTQLALTYGVNSLIATTGDLNPNPPYNEDVDIEYVRIDLPAGAALTNIYLQSYQGDDGVAFIGIREGETFGFSRDDVYEHLNEMLGGAHVGPGNGHMIGTDLLPVLGSGYIGVPIFQPPLTAPSYTFWIQQTGVKIQYQLDFVVVPEPATFVALGLAPGLLLIACRPQALRRIAMRGASLSCQPANSAMRKGGKPLH